MIVIFVIFISLIMNYSKVICGGKKKLSILKAFIKLLLLCTGQILSVIFKLLSCQTIGNNYFVHFYLVYIIIWFIIYYNNI